jgi:hypothetical protein
MGTIKVGDTVRCSGFCKETCEIETRRPKVTNIELCEAVKNMVNLLIQYHPIQYMIVFLI